MVKGDIVEISINDISEQGQGIGRLENLVIFVKGALPRDIVKARISKLKKNYALGEATELVEASPFRVKPICPHYECGGCLHRELEYEAQLRLKQTQVMEKLYRLGGLSKDLNFDIIGADNPYHYRNKAQLPVSTGGCVVEKGGIIRPVSRPIVGFYKMGTHDVVECEHCRLQPKVVMRVAAVLSAFISSDHLSSYDVKWDKGLFRHLIVKVAEGTGEIMVIFVVNGKGIPNVEKLIVQLDKEIANFSDNQKSTGHYSLESVYINTLKGKSNKNMGEINKLIAGKATILEKLGDLYFEISPSAFYQVNPLQTVALYNKVLEFADLNPEQNLLDLYCGVGSIGIWCASRLKKQNKNCKTPGQVLGIESIKEAVLDANRNAVINNLVNARFICGKAEEELDKIIEGYTDKDGFKIEPFHADVVVIDPPRSGCKPSLFSSLQKLSAKKLIYVSCEPSTLARDMAKLREIGYKVKDGAIVDMFPHTGRTEVVILMVM